MDREIIGLIADGIGIAGAVFALFAWLQTRRIRTEQKLKELRDNREVTIILQGSGSERYVVPVKLRRREFTRAEILGRIGMIPTREGQPRFQLRYTNTSDFLNRVNTIVSSDGDAELIIPVRDDEWAKFEFEAE